MDADGQHVVRSARQLLSVAFFVHGVKGLRKSLMVEAGLPVAMLRPHPDTPHNGHADGTLFTLNTPGAAARLLAHEHVMRGTAAAATPARRASAADIRRMMCGDLANADARRALLLRLIGENEAARMLKLREGAVMASAARADAAAAAAVASWEMHLLAECIHDGVTNIRDASPVTLARARRRFAAALAAPPARDPLLLFQGATDVFFARCRRALDWVLLHFGRESPHQTVKVGDQHMPRIDLCAPAEAIFREYDAFMQRHNETALSRSSFLRHVILPQMKLITRKTCLCSHCEDGREAIQALTELLSELPADIVDADTVLALRARLSALESDLRTYSTAVCAKLEEDELDAEMLNGKLRFSDLLEEPVAALDGLGDAIDAAAQQAPDPDAVGDWLTSMRTHASAVDKYKRHLLGRSWQNVRQRQKRSLLEVKFAAGIRAVMIIVDFKAKQPAKTGLRERQSEHWDNSTISIIGFVIIWWDGSCFRREYIDYVSDDTQQDAVWTANAVRELAKDLAGRGFHEMMVDSDNAYHFHNNYVFSDIVPSFVRSLQLRNFAWGYCEPGEGKDEADGHFGACAVAWVQRGGELSGTCGAGVIGKASEEYVIRHGVLNGINDWVKCISGLSATGLSVTARAIVIDRSGVDTTRWKWENINAYKEFRLRSDWLSFADSCPSPEELMRGSWLVRDYTGNGDLQPLTAGAFTTGWLPMSAEESIDLLTVAMQRPGRNGAPGQSRMELLPKLIGVGGLITDSSRFGEKGSLLYTSAVFVLKHLLMHGYTPAERKAAAVGAQTTPHTLAAAIVQVEARRRRATHAATTVSGARGGAGAAGAATGARGGDGAAGAAAGAAAAAAAVGSVNAAARNVAATASNVAATRSVGMMPQTLSGRAAVGLSEEARARVRAAVAMAAEGASIDCVVRATLRGVLGGDVPAHPDAQAQRAPLPALEYGDEL